MRWIILDTETTGPTPADKICEIAWAEVDAGINVIDLVHSLIDPEIPVSASASGVHGLTNVELASEPTIEEFFTIVKPNAFDGDIFLVAHNSSFDVRYVGPWIPNLAGQLCTLRLARRVFPEVENHKLSTLKFALDLDRGTSHRADGDVMTTLSLLRKIAEKSGMTLPELAAQAMEPVRVAKMPFGKHKGWEIKTLPANYVKWLLNLDNLDRDMRWSLENPA